MPGTSLASYDSSLSKNALPHPPKLISFQEIESTLQKLLSTKEGIEEILSSQKLALRFGCTSMDDGSISRLPIQTLGQSPQPKLKCGKGAQVCIKTGYKQDGDVMVSKIAGGGGDTTGNTGAVLVFNQNTLRLSAVLCDEGLLTEVRTAAACAFVSRMILSTYHENDLSKIKKIGIIGGGVQAVWQLRFLGAILFSGNDAQKCVVIQTTSRDSANAFIEKMENSTYPPDREWTFEHYESVANSGKGFTECQLIHTLTPSRSPVLFLEDICVGCENENAQLLHITCVGADSPGKCEIDPKIIRKANALLCDSIPQSHERGEFQLSRNLSYEGSLLEVGSIVDDEGAFDSFCSMLKGNDTALTIFDSSGLAIQDVEMADLMSKHL